MRSDALLAGVAAVSLLALVAVAVLVPGFLADPTESAQPPGRFDVAEMTLEAGEVTGETATLQTTAYLRHRGGSAENVTVVTRATDTDSGLLVDTDRSDLGTLENEGERETTTAVTVPREGGYEIRTILYVDDERADTARATVSGVGALTPPYARTDVSFHRFGELPAVEYSVASTAGNETTLDVATYLTNGGDDPEGDLRLEVTARQADSDVVAARAERTVGQIAPGRTDASAVQVSVPDGYNYYLDVTLWRDGVVLESTRAAATLDPAETLSPNETRRDVRFEASDFETTSGSPRGSADAADGPEAGSADGAGFGAAVAVVALLAALVATRRWSA